VKEVNEMESFIMTDWITIKGQETVASIPQSASGWLELDDEHKDREDVTFYLEVKEATNVLMSYETAAVRQDNQFVAMVAPFTMTTGVRVDVCSADSVAVPAAGLLRWKLKRASGNVWSATFRLAVTAHSYGGG
jgi:hypothetical protein